MEDLSWMNSTNSLEGSLPTMSGPEDDANKIQRVCLMACPSALLDFLVRSEKANHLIPSDSVDRLELG